MESAPENRTLRLAEDVAALASAGLLAAWAFSDRSAAWTVPLGAAIAVMAAIFVRRLVGLRPAKRGPGDHG